MGSLLSKRAAAKKKTDLNHDKAHDLAGNPNNTANNSQGLGPVQLLSYQLELEPNNGNEAMLTKIYQVPAVDAPQNREQSWAVNISQDVDPVKYIPYLPSSERETQQHKSLTKPKDNKTSAPKAMLQQATPERPTAEPCDCVKGTAGQLDALKSDILHDVRDNLSQQQQTKRMQHQREQREKRWVVYVHNQHRETTEAPLVKGLVHRPCKGKVREENWCSKEAKTQRKTNINNLPSQTFNCILSPVIEESTDLTCQVTDKAHNIAKLSTTTKTGIAEVPATVPSKSPDHSRQMSSQPKAEVNNEENAQHKHCLNYNSVTYTVVENLYSLSAKSESSRATAAKMRLRQKLANKIKAQPGDGGKSPVVTVQESPQQQGGTAKEENTTKKRSEPHETPRPNKSDDDTCIQKVKVKAPASLVPAVEGKSASHKSTTDTSIRLLHEFMVPLPQDTAVKPKTKCTTKALNQNQPKNTGNETMKEEMNGKSGQVKKEQEPAISSLVTPAPEGRWHPFTVNQSCPRKAHCRHNMGTGLPPNVQNWFKECPNHLCGHKNKIHRLHSTVRKRGKRFSTMGHPQYARLKGQCVGLVTSSPE